MSAEFGIEGELFTFGCSSSNGLTWQHVDTESVNEWHPGAGFNFLGLGSEYRTDYNASSNEFSGGITNEVDSPGLKDSGISWLGKIPFVKVIANSSNPLEYSVQAGIPEVKGSMGFGAKGGLFLEFNKQINMTNHEKIESEGIDNSNGAKEEFNPHNY